MESVAKSAAGRGIAAENLYRQARELLGKTSTGREGLQPGVRQSVRHHVDYRGEAGVVAREGQRTSGERLDGDEPDRLREHRRRERDIRCGKEPTELA